jgi:hypothetical protein
MDDEARDPLTEAEFTDPLVRIVYLAMWAIAEEARASVMSLFCRSCYRYLGADGICHCANDE